MNHFDCDLTCCSSGPSDGPVDTTPEPTCSRCRTELFSEEIQAQRDQGEDEPVYCVSCLRKISKELGDQGDYESAWPYALLAQEISEAARA